MALDGITIGSVPTATGGTPPVSSVAPTGGALSGFTIGSSRDTAVQVTTAPISSIVASSKTPDTSGMFSNFLSLNNMKTQTSTPAVMPVAKQETVKDQASKNPVVAALTGGSTIKKFASDVLGGLPDASKKVSDAVNNVVINKPADLLSNTNFIKQSATGIDSGSVSGLFAEELLRKLSYGLQSVAGVTGGLYQAPDNPTQDMTDKLVKTLSQGIGMAVSLSSIGSVAGSIPGVSGAVSGLTNLVGKYPLLAKYIAPYIKPLVESTIAFSAYSQLDPKLADNIGARAKTLAVSIGTAPLYTALGAIKSAGVSLPVSFGLGFGMAKLSGASNQDAIASGAALAFLDGVGRNGGSRGLTPDEIQAKLKSEALKTLNKYSLNELTTDSSMEDFKLAYRAAAHQTHPDVGGSAEDFMAVKSAYDLLSKGAVSAAPSNITEAEQSVKALKSDIQAGIQEHGEGATTLAVSEHLGVDTATSNKLVRAAQIPEDDGFGSVSKEVLNNITPSSHGESSGIVSGETKLFFRGGGEGSMPKGMTGADVVKYEQDELSNIIKATPGVDLSKIPSENLTWLTESSKTAKEYGVVDKVPMSDYRIVARDGQGGILVEKMKAPNALKDISITQHITEDIPQLQKNIQSIYKGAGKSESVPGAHRADEILSQIFTELELSKAGQRIVVPSKIGGGGEFKGIPSTFPQWIPEEFRSKALFEKIMGGLDVENIKFPAGPKQRALYNILLDEADAQLGVDTKEIRDKITSLYEAKNNVKKEVARSDNRGAKGSVQGAENPKLDEWGEVIEPSLENKITPNTQGGFANPGAMVEDIVKGADAKVKDFIETTMKPIEVKGNLMDSFIKLEGEAQADLESVNQLVQELDIDKKDDEALYAHAENPQAPLTTHQQELEKKFDLPFKKLNAELYARIKNDGIALPESDTYISRFPKEKPSVMQRIFSPTEGRTASSGQGSVLSKTAPSLKKRTMKALTDAEGNRIVVSIKDGRVTAFTNKTPSDLGNLSAKRSPKVKEFFDENVMPKLEKLAQDLGITHTRHTSSEKGLGGNRAGVSFTGQNKVKTRVATPERVLLHEIGHQIDERYGLQEIFKKDDARNYGKDTSQAELRALADLRIEGKTVGVDVSKHFAESYIRNGAEKMAVMFEAYLHVPEKFEEVAPNIFEKFEEFLSHHAELKPILDIKPSLVLGTQTIGGDLLGGKSGDTFIDKNKKKYTIGEATTAEIEQHTNLQYHHSALASRLMQYVKLRQIDRANQFLESWKASEDFAKVGQKSDQLPPAGWKMTSQVNFRNYFFEPRVAEALDDMQKKMDSGNYNDAFQGINRTLANAIFFNGIAHPMNVAVTWAYNRGASSLVIPSAYKSGFKAFARAATAMQTKNEDYMDLLRNGAHLMSSDVTNKKLAENLLKKLGADMDAKPALAEKLAAALGYAKDQIGFKNNVIYRLSHAMAWLSNDFLTIQSIFETMDRRGLSMVDAIKEVSRFIPDYRQQTRLLDAPLSATLGNERGGATARTLSKIVYNRNISMFGSYHVGLMQSLSNAIKDTAKGTDWTFGSESNKQRAAGADKLAMLAILGLIVFPFLDKLAQMATRKPETYVTRFGILKYPYLAYKYFTGRTSTTQVAQSIITPAVGTEAMIELFFNRDLFTGNNIYGPGGEGVGGYIASKIAPVAEATKIATDKTTVKDFALSLLGVHTPKNSQLALDLNAMIYNEKPNVVSDMKALIAGGDEDGAKQLGHDFNTRLSAQIKAADIAGGNSGSDARVAFFLNQNGVKMPGALAMSNYNAKYGKGIVDKLLPNGKPVVATATELPPTGIIGVITTYAKAIGTDPITAFRDIFAGESIRQVKNGAIIVNRMSFSQSQKDKADLGGGTIPKGMILDHIVPLEAGGTNDKENLQLITTAQDGSAMNQPVEDFVGKELGNGNMTSAEAREISIRFKAGSGQKLSPSLLKEYQDKYQSKPLTIDQVQNYKDNLLDK